MTRQDIEKIDDQIRQLRKQREHELWIMQEKCNHPVDELLEVEYEKHILSTSPPFRVCKLCGYAEEGWGCGYWRLETNEEIPRISCSKARHDYILKFYTQKKMNEKRYAHKKN